MAALCELGAKASGRCGGFRIDDETEVPTELFMRLLSDARRSGRGQHVLQGKLRSQCLVQNTSFLSRARTTVANAAGSSTDITPPTSSDPPAVRPLVMLPIRKRGDETATSSLYSGWLQKLLVVSIWRKASHVGVAVDALKHGFSSLKSCVLCGQHIAYLPKACRRTVERRKTSGFCRTAFVFLSALHVEFSIQLALPISLAAVGLMVVSGTLFTVPYRRERWSCCPRYGGIAS